MLNENYDVTVEVGGGELFASSGQVLDFSGNVTGTFGTVDTNGRLFLSSDGSRAYFFGLNLTGPAVDYYTVSCFDPRTYTPSGGFEFPTSTVSTELPGIEQGLQWGDGGAALALSDPGASAYLVLLPDMLSRVHGCAPTMSPPMQYGCITGPDLTSGGDVLGYELAASALATNPVTGTLYASVSSEDSRYPNSVVGFVPGKAGVAWSTYVGSSPGPIGVSSAGDVAWVGLTGTPQVTSVNLASNVAGSPFVLPRDATNGDVYPTEMHAVPGANESVVATGGFLGTTAAPGVFVYDNGVLRFPYSGTTQVLENGTAVSSVAFGADAGVLYGDGDDGLTVMQLGPTALDVVSTFPTLIPGEGYMPIQYASGKIFDAFGVVVNPTTGDAGTLAISGAGMYVEPTFTLSPDGGRYYYVGSGANAASAYVIQCFDTTSLALTGSITFTSLEYAAPIGIALYGSTGLAVTTGDTLMILPNALATAGCEP